MTNPFKAIAISLIPNFEFADVIWSKLLFLMPWKYLDTKWAKGLEVRLKNYLGRKDVISFESGRAAEYFLLKALGVGSGDEVIIQALTCVAVPNSILWNGAKPIYVDVDESLNIDPEELERAITKRTKAVIFQYSFGNPGQIGKVVDICRKRKILLIEDCAHGLGNEIRDTGYWRQDTSIKPRKVGAIGDAAFFSFGRDKVISGIWGGAVATDSLSLSQSLRKLIETECREHKRLWVAKQLVYAPVMFVVVQTYSFLNLGKIVHWFFSRIGLLSKVLGSEEKLGGKQKVFYRGMPGAMAKLASRQLEKLDRFITHRKELARFYANELGEQFDEASSFLRFNIFVEDAQGLRKFASKKNIFLGDWYDFVVAPRGVNLARVGYVLGSCPKAERVAGQIVNLPTGINISLSDAEKIIRIIKEWKLKK